MRTRPDLNAVVKQLKTDTENSVFVDVSRGKEKALDIPRNRLNLAVNVMLESGDYVRYYVRSVQHGTGKTVTIEALAKRGTAYNDIVNALSLVNTK